MKKIALILLILFSTLASTKVANAAWSHDGYGYTSNICRYGPYWQVVPWNYVGTDCYMPGWAVWGKRVAE